MNKKKIYKNDAGIAPDYYFQRKGILPYGTETEFCDITGIKLKIGDYVAYSFFVVTSGDFYNVGQCIYRHGKLVFVPIHGKGCLDDFCVCNAKSIKIINKQESLLLSETHEMQDIECLFGG